MKVLGLVVFAACGVGSLLCGCGGSASLQSTSVLPANGLAGNWLIVGPMPEISPSVTNPTGTTLQLALTVDEVGNNLVAGGSGDLICNGSAGAFGLGLSGTVAQDGTVTLHSPGSANGPLVIGGKASASASTLWSGNYTMSPAAFTSLSSSCVGTLSNTFTAVPFPLVSGVYAGTATGTTIINDTPTTITLQMTLQQGGTATDTLTGATETSNIVLTGSLKVQGSPCFNSGTTTGLPSSTIMGNRMLVTFTMDDGSTLQLIGMLTDVGESRIATDLVSLSGGKCGGGTIPVVYQMGELDRQN